MKSGNETFGAGSWPVSVRADKDGRVSSDASRVGTARFAAVGSAAVRYDDAPYHHMPCGACVQADKTSR
jgi:hypothetical protein